ncbi:MAG: Dabb family protein [Oscillospiraceae bacterium]|jgi:hypothetical protein|nr:Dabb family protein [Oscillospiraceae bacterium]
MVMHLVFWQLKDEALGRDKDENARLIKDGLEGLVGVVPGLRQAHVGRNENGGPYDLALAAVFDSAAALHAYETHPAHQQVRALVTQVRLDRAAVDFTAEEEL